MDNLRPLFHLDPSVVFLNHGSFGACPRPVFQTSLDWQLQLERQPVAFLDPARGYGAFLRTARERLAAYVGAQAQDLVGVTNATQALNIAIRSLPFEAGDEVVTTDHEYAALDKTWAFVAARTGLRIVPATVPLPLTSEQAFHDAIFAQVTPRTRAIFLSHITSATALRFPIEPVVAEARARGLWTIIDGAHAPGHIPLALDALGADVYAGNCHKWMLSPKGAGFLHVRRDVQPLIDPLVISHGWTPDAAEPGPFGNTAFIDRLEMQGTRDPAAFLSVPAALDFMDSHDWPRVCARAADLVTRAEARMAALTGLAPFAPPQFRAPQMASLRLPRTDPRALQTALMDRWRIEIPCFDWQDNTIARVSGQGYTTDADMDLLVAALSELLTLGRAA